MKNSKNIFIQVDTDRVIKELKFDLHTPINVRESSYIYDQGLMAMGHAEKNFNIETKTGDTLFFTIIPLRLYSFHKIYFTEFKILTENNEIITTSSLTDEHVSFSIQIKRADKNSSLSFDLLAVIEHQDILDKTVRLPILIDPVLRANQGN